MARRGHSGLALPFGLGGVNIWVDRKRTRIRLASEAVGESGVNQRKCHPLDWSPSGPRLPCIRSTLISHLRRGCLKKVEQFSKLPCDFAVTLFPQPAFRLQFTGPRDRTLMPLPRTVLIIAPNSNASRMLHLQSKKLDFVIESLAQWTPLRSTQASPHLDEN